MYNERNDNFSIKDIAIQILFAVLFLFILVWLFPTKGYLNNKLNVNVTVTPSDQVLDVLFNSNVQTMQNAATNYFTTSRLPKNVGDSVRLTLGEMINQKLILPFVDSEGNSCDLNTSYVEITKMDEEYTLKVNLSCTTKTDYIIVHMGCYSYCDQDICIKEDTAPSKPDQTTKPPKPTDPKPTDPKPTDPDPEPITKKYQYQYILRTDGYWSNWSNWSAWSTTKAIKNDTTDVETRLASKYINGSYDYASKITTYDYKCPSGYSSSGSNCIKANSSISATRTEEYGCMSGYTEVGSGSNMTCKKDYGNAKIVDYSCPSGYTEVGSGSNTTCRKFIAMANADISCSQSGYQAVEENGKWICKKETAAKVDYYCAKGDVVGTKCVETVKATPKTTAGYWTTPVKETFNKKMSSTSTVKYTNGTSKTVSSCAGCTATKVYCYDVSYYKAGTTTYVCPDGYSEDGSGSSKTCKKTIGNATKKYTCSNGIAPNSSNKCVSTASANVEYWCQEGTLSGQKCYAIKKATPVYDCTYGKLNGTTCTATMKATATIKYSCPNTEYTLSNTICVPKNSFVSIPATLVPTITCPSGYSDYNGTLCSKYISGYYTTVTEYRYRTRSYIDGKEDEKWSTSDNDADLIKQGYKYTGVLKEIEQKV